MKCQLFFQSLSLKRNWSPQRHSSNSDLNYETQELLWYDSVFYQAYKILGDILRVFSDNTCEYTFYSAMTLVPAYQNGLKQ